MLRSAGGLQMVRALRYHDYRWLWISGIGEFAGVAVQAFSLAWLVLEISGGSFAQLGFMTFLRGLAMMVFLPLGGVAADPIRPPDAARGVLSPHGRHLCRCGHPDHAGPHAALARLRGLVHHGSWEGLQQPCAICTRPRRGPATGRDERCGSDLRGGDHGDDGRRAYRRWDHRLGIHRRRALSGRLLLSSGHPPPLHDST